jgi:general secretion pathway protein E
VNQVQVNPRAGRTFAACLRFMLRQDPNIIMAGEIRDSETAEIALQASQTGHLALSTLHTNDGIGAITRPPDLNQAGFLIASSVTAVIAQPLVRRLCSCRRELAPTLEQINELASLHSDRCLHCGKMLVSSFIYCPYSAKVKPGSAIPTTAIGRRL